MVVKSQIKFIKSLRRKKIRAEQKLFVAEGPKMVSELYRSALVPYKIYTSGSVMEEVASEFLERVTVSELKQMSSLKNPNQVLGVFYMPTPKKVDFTDWVVALDEVRDPGNLGTIIRMCDWFGINHLLCSTHTVDCYNPKVLQATMGAIARINIIYSDLPSQFQNTEVPVYGSFMDAAPVYDEKMPTSGILLMGNEANGISQEIEKHIAKKIGIPQYAAKTSESLNVAMATAILLNEIRRG
ncbi:RNA methyltransferase [Flavobacteriaceae bacterium F89]|uniref:RNA methyltransferase n=1 Tax=Cerina litoralis TaxID=2874477 RepID=A0AAE3EUG5_9FLAO|nr:RNA methyltransferase [Cerina litoralis]MCG2461138.1 RNA methyltransferase [Cerina litoralis]